MVTPAAKREAVAHLCSAFEMSERRACKVAGCIRMTVRYRSRRADDVPLLEPNVSINESSGHKHLHHVCSLRQAKLHPHDWVKFQACIILGFPDS
jgi:hypothetical protein